MSPSLPGGIRSSQMNTQTLKRPLKTFTSELPSKAEVKVKTQRMNSDRQTEGKMADFPLTPAGVPLREETKLLACVQEHFQLVPIPETCPPDLVSSRPGVLHTSTASEGCCIQSHTFKNLFRLLKLKEFHSAAVTLDLPKHPDGGTTIYQLPCTLVLIQIPIYISSSVSMIPLSCRMRKQGLECQHLHISSHSEDEPSFGRS